MMNLLNLFKDFYIFMPYRHSGGHEKIWKDMLPLLVCLETLDFFLKIFFSVFQYYEADQTISVDQLDRRTSYCPRSSF